MGDDPLPPGIYTDQEAAVVRYAQQSTRSIRISDEMYDELAGFFTEQQIMELCLVVGLSQMVNRFHATFLTDVDETTLEDNAAADATLGGRPIDYPPIAGN